MLKKAFRFLAACGAALLAVGATNAAEAQTKLRCQSSFPPSSTSYENSKLFAERVKVLSGGRLEMEMMPGPAMRVDHASSHRNTAECFQIPKAGC